MRVLVLRFSAIGDCIMAAWAVSALRRSFPDAHITWAVQERAAPAIDTEHLVDELLILPRERWKRARFSPQTWAEQFAAYSSVHGRFDLGLDLQGHLKTTLLLRASGAARMASISSKDAIAARLSGAGPVQHGKHMIERHFDILRRFGVTDDGLPPIMPKLEPERARVLDLIGGIEEPIVTIQTGAGNPEKIYPAERWRTVATALAATGYRVVSIGAPDDSPLELPGVLDLVGRLSLRESMAAVSLSAMHLASDTGTGHAAAAYGVPVVSLFGYMDPAEFAPRGARVIEAERTAMIEPQEILNAALETLESGVPCAY